MVVASDAVLGLMQDPDNKRILLVRKAREPHAGLFGLPAGNLKDGETALAAVVRKFEEELGIKTTPDEWQLRARFDESGRQVYVYYARGSIGRARKCEDEQPYHLPHDAALIREPLMPDLQWVIPLVLYGPVALLGD